MTDTTKGCTVAFEKDIRVDDVRAIVDAIKMISGVADVELHITDTTDFLARAHVKAEIRDELLTLYKNI